MFKKINRRLTKFLIQKYPNWDISIALRYLPIAKDIKRNFKNGDSILDVGSGEFGLATYLEKGYEITGTDVDFGKRREKKVKLVEASAENLPFKHNSFDCVVSVDMLEHLPGDIRKKAISEMIRVAKRKAYISFPRGNFSSWIDIIISKYYKFTHKEELAYLSEHQKYVLPNEDKVKLYISQVARENAKKVLITRKVNTNSLLWLGLLLLGFSEKRMLTNLYHKLLLLLPVLNLMHFWPTYRVSYFVDFRNND